MLRTAPGAWLTVFVVAGALLMMAQPVSAQQREGSGTKAREGSVERERGRADDAARGRTSGRSDRGSIGRGEREDTAEREAGAERETTRDGRVERTRTERTERTERAERERIPDILRRRDDERNDDEYYGTSGRKGNGPPFCRSGAGHPVHGMAWCYEKGWGRSDQRVRRDDRDLDDVIIIDRDQRTRVGERGGVLGDILGDVVRGPLFDEIRLSR